jgi:hypothetical protein
VRLTFIGEKKKEIIRVAVEENWGRTGASAVWHGGADARLEPTYQASIP